MPVLVPPSTFPVPGGTATPPTQVATFTLKVGDSVTMGFASCTPDPGVSRTDWDCAVLRTGSFSGPVVFNPNARWTDTNRSFTYSPTTQQVLFLTILGGGEPKDSSHGTVFGYHVETAIAVQNNCQYGTQLKTPGQFVYYLTPGLIATACEAVGMAWMAPVFVAFYFTTINADDLCSSAPPIPPPVGIDIWDSSTAALSEWLNAILWNFLCQCKPGTPSPIPYPPPAMTQPPGGPAAPTFGCSNTDICAALVVIQQQLAAVNQVASNILQLDTVVQRSFSPFASIRGATHTNVSTSGVFAISRLVGMVVEVVSRPGGEQLFTGEPTYISDLGWMSVLTDDDMIEEVRLTRSTQVWMPRLMPLATQFGIALRDGVVVNLTELHPEP